jgi:signal transduction histidine kinase
MISLMNLSDPQLVKGAMDDWVSFIASIDESTEDAIAVVSDLIDFDKLTNGMLNIERGIHNVWNLVCDTVKPFQVQARSKNVTMSSTLLKPDFADGVEGSSDDSSTLVVFGDSVKLQQVLRNLISNALKFTSDRGEVRITGKEENKRESFYLLKIDLSFKYFSCCSFSVFMTTQGFGIEIKILHPS